MKDQFTNTNLLNDEVKKPCASGNNDLSAEESFQRNMKELIKDPILKCKGIGCDYKGSCTRYTTNGGHYWQSCIAFIADQDGDCKYFLLDPKKTVSAE
jgi:hypothetical protein